MDTYHIVDSFLASSILFVWLDRRGVASPKVRYGLSMATLLVGLTLSKWGLA